MNLIYVYSLNYILLGSFYAASGYGISQEGAQRVVNPNTLGEIQRNERLSQVVFSSIMKQSKVIVKRMD
jgi:hypothetical protein